MLIPKPYPTTLEECLKIFETIKYESYGFPVFFLYYNYSVPIKGWSVGFRNAKNFNQPDICEKNPVDACYKMFDFLNKLRGKGSI